MAPQLFFLPAVAYVFIYVHLVDRAVEAVRAIFQDYEKAGKTVDKIGWTGSITAVKLMLDPTMPREDFPVTVKRKIALARFFFYTCAPVGFVCWLLMVLFAS